MKKIFIHRKKLERLRLYSKEIQEKIRRYEEIFNNDNVILWEADKTGCLTCLNSSAKETLGYDLEHLDSHPFFQDLFPEMCRKEYAQKFRPLYAHQQSLKDLACPVTAADGSIVWLSVNASPLLNQDGHLKGFVGSARDITTYMDALDRIKAAKAYQEALLESIDELIVVLDHQLVFQEVYTNRPEDLLIEETQLMGKPLDELGIEEPARSRMIEGVKKAQRNGTTVQINYRLRHGNSPGAYAARISPLKDGDGYQRGVVAAIRKLLDVTDGGDQTNC